MRKSGKPNKAKSLMIALAATSAALFAWGSAQAKPVSEPINIVQDTCCTPDGCGICL